MSLINDYLRESLRLVAQTIIEWEVSAAIAASHYERNADRRTQRNGYRQRVWQTSLGEIVLHIPKLRKGAYYPAFLESLRHAEPALIAFVQDAYQRGLTLRDMQSALDHLGLTEMHPSHLADMQDQLHDLIARYKSRQNNPQAAVSAISTKIIRLDSPSAELPQASLGGTVQPFALALLEMWLHIRPSVGQGDESLQLLQRIHQALADSTSAVALAA